MSTKRPAAAVAAGALCLIIAACGSSAHSDSASTGKPVADTSGSGGYPVTLDNCGMKETFTGAPSRVVVMNGASVAEVSTLLALGLGDRIVANEQTYGMSEVPGRADAVKALPTGGVKLNDAFDIPREAMVGLRPDLVLSTTAYGFDAKNGFATRQQLRDLHANSYISPQGCDQDGSKMTVQDSYALLRDMGRVFGVPDRAEKIVSAAQQRIAAVGAKVAGKEQPKVMVVFSNMTMGANAFSAVAAHGIYNDILADAGGSNAFASATTSAFADLSKEAVAAADVDALVVISYNDPHSTAYAQQILKEFPQWPASRNNTYTILSDSMYLGPSNDLAVDRIARMLHPDAF